MSATDWSFNRRQGVGRLLGHLTRGRNARRVSGFPLWPPLVHLEEEDESKCVGLLQVETA
jgi:hypothetical protein